MYKQSVLPMTHTLGALAKILTKAEAHCEAKGIKPQALLTFRLFPDMLDFTRQVQLTCDFAARAAARLTGMDVPGFPDTETTFPELQARIATARAYLATFTPSQFADAADRVVTLKLRTGEMVLSGSDYLSLYSLPQFYFHATTAYDILRHNGVEIGKADFMGA